MKLKQLLLFNDERGGGRRPALVLRPRLEFPPAPHPYRDVLPWTPPLSRDFLRADSWGITIPGAPWIPGGSSRHPERMLSWFLDRYPLDLQWQYLETTASYGYTHVRLSIGDSMGPRDNGPLSPPGHEQTIEQVIATCKRIQSVISPRDGRPLSVRMMLGSKYFHPKDMSVGQYQDRFGPILDQLFRARAVDEVTPGWEWNLWNVPGNTTLGIYKWVGRLAHLHGVTCWSHMAPHFVSWQADTSDRFQFWADLGDDMDGLDYQGEPTWTIDELQARMIDTLWAFGRAGNRHKFRMDEDLAVLQFDGHPAPGTNRPADEGQATARGFLACCTVDVVHRTDAKVWGYGNGGSLPKGEPL